MNLLHFYKSYQPLTDAHNSGRIINNKRQPEQCNAWRNLYYFF